MRSLLSLFLFIFFLFFFFFCTIVASKANCRNVHVNRFLSYVRKHYANIKTDTDIDNKKATKERPKLKVKMRL